MVWDKLSTEPISDAQTLGWSILSKLITDKLLINPGYSGRVNNSECAPKPILGSAFSFSGGCFSDKSLPPFI